eukprot:3238381-Pyramimonas_sp.AAC.1
MRAAGQGGPALGESVGGCQNRQACEQRSKGKTNSARVAAPFCSDARPFLGRGRGHPGKRRLGR